LPSIVHSHLCSEPLWQRLQHKQHAIAPTLQNWLLDKTSLTEKLVEKSKGRFRVEVLQQRIQRIRLSEHRALHIKSRRWAVVREVILYGNNTPWVYARTVIPLNTLQGSLRRLHYLGNKPLGRQLFSHPNMTREPLEVAELSPHHLPNIILSDIGQSSPLNNTSKLPIWGRRSVFRLTNKPLLVSEVFLPELFN